MNKVLIIGLGGREHALAWSVSKSKNVSEVLVAPGNPGIERDEKCRNVAGKDFKELADVVERESVDQIIVGPEQHLVEGIVDFFYGEGFKNIFGPKRISSLIESDKFFSYELMEELNIPQAESTLCSTTEEAEAAVVKMSTGEGIVIKARGLTAGKGVYVCDSKDQALVSLREHSKNYGSEVLIAQRLFGQEFSVFGISDGNVVVPLEISVQDHKRLLYGDKGPNTGGMGAYCPVPIADFSMVRNITERMMTPIVKKMKEDGAEYKGFIYASVIMTRDGPKILEFNCRFGDPEAQPVVMMLKNGLHEPIMAALEGRIGEVDIDYKPGVACCVVMASNGYPGSYEKGFEIGGLDSFSSDNIKVFHAGTKNEKGKILTSGGRVLGVTAYCNDVITAKREVYKAVELIDGFTTEMNNRIVFIYRRDIASKALTGKF